jgi:cysteine-rich repeat protein
MARRWLIVSSALAHVAIAGGLYVSGVWRIERLEAPRFEMRGLGVMLPPPALSGGPVAAKTPPIDRKRPKRKPPVIVQPDTPKPDADKPDFNDNRGVVTGADPNDSDDETAPCIENCGESKVAPPVCGDGARDVNEQCDDGNVLDGDGCSSTCRTEPRAPKPTVVSPTVLSGLRISGNTDVHPSSVTQSAMIRADTRSVRAVFLVCVGADGSVARAERRVSTRYPDYDEALQSAIERWRYRPYRVDGAPVQACSTVEFRYTLR